MIKKLIVLTFISIINLKGFSQNKLPLTLESIWSGYFDEKNIQPHILNKQPAVSFIRADKETNFEGIITLDMITGKIIDTIFTNQTKVEADETPVTFAFFEDFSFAPDDSKILIKTEKQAIYHNSHKEFTYIWDDVKKTLKPVSTDGKISCAEFNSNGKYLSYLRDANLYIRNTENDKITTVTTDGAFGSIINGMADEVYEDGFGLTKMYQWSPDGNKIAFIKINQAFIKKHPIISYEKAEPSITQQVFTKPGEAISEASIYIYDVKGNFFTKLDVGGNPNQYIVNFKWQPNGESIFVERLNRAQRKLEVIQCNSTNGNYLKTIITEEKPDYIKINNDNIFFTTNSNFLWLTEKDGYNHIYDVDFLKNVTTQITKGKWEVNSIQAYDSLKQKIYFMANPTSPTQNHLYAINITGKGLEKITNDRGWHTTWMSKDFKYFFDKSTTVNSPSMYKIFKTTGAEITNKAIIENKRFQENLKGFDVNDCKMFSFNNDKGTELNGWIINGDNVEGAKKKPLLLYVYGGNNKQEVLEEWNDRMAMTFRFFANKGYTVACIDPRGTSGRGEAFRKASYNNLADVPMEDIIDAKDYIIKKYNVDPQKTALMGWSYGGYITTIAATMYGGSFNKYIAIAPVTNWRDYNAIYTERILQMPSDNPEKYKDLKPEEHLNEYKGGLLLIHGSADDNVHVNHTLKLAKALTETDSYYDIHIFTDKGHNLSDGNIDKTRMNLFKKILKFLDRPDITK